MIPLSLTLSGIYSYQQPQTIDFTRLTEASIFGIFGTVGSGKSTILEAISYALYGETERLNQRENRGYNMMNLKSNELLIDFTFRAGEDGQEYRFKVSGKRNRNNFEKINTFERTAYRKAASEWVPIEVESAERIIGLSYQNFRRTIIIPQGKFQEFLQLGDTDRTRMMKELFNLNKFELFHKVTALEKKNSDEKMVLEDRLKQIGDVEASQLELRREALLRLQKEIDANAQLLSEKQQVDSAFAQLKELFEKIQVQSAAMKILQGQENQFCDLEVRIRNYEHCSLHFKGLFENQRNTQAEVVRLSAVLRSQHNTWQETTKQLATESSSFSHIKVQYENREALKTKAEELEKIVQVLDLESEAAQLKERLSNGEMHYSRALYKVGQIRQAQEALSAEIKSLKATLLDTTEITAVSHWFAVNNQLQGLKKSLAQDAGQVKGKIKQLKAQKDSLLTSTTAILVPRATKETPIAELPELFTDAKTNLEGKLVLVDGELQHLHLQSKLEEYAANLQVGLPCPLCGSPEHPHKLDASQVNKILAEKQRSKSQYHAQISQLALMEKQLSTYAVQYTGQQELLAQVSQKLEAQEAKLTEHQQTFPSGGFNPADEAHFQRVLNETKRLQERIEEKENQLEKLGKQLPAEEKNREKLRLELEVLQKALAEITGKTATYQEQISQLNISDYVWIKPAALRQEAQQQVEQYERIGRAYQAAEKTIQALQVEIGTLNGRIQTGETSLQVYQTQLAALSHQLNEALAASAFESVEEIQAVLSLPMELEQEKSRVDGFRRQLHTAQTQYQTLVEQAQGKSYDQQAHAELLEEITRLREARNVLRRQAVTLENEITQMEIDLQLRRTLLQKLEAIGQRAEDIATLKKMFRESGFVNYVSSVYLQNMCKAANERFYKLTRQKLQLEITDKNEFQIRDFLHNGQVRSVKTLSGGQTFQAALCLALALADNIQQLTQSPQNFFFLDEGFGSLDKESLQIVFDTLKSLRKENRIVGVISHVEEMQHEIDTYLKIRNDEVTGSVVEVSWR